jgi:sugar-specific transcriptional regulator TrmB
MSKKRTENIMTDTLDNFFCLLGLTPEETLIFRTLSALGSMPILKLARLTKLPRTRVYRITQKMTKAGLLQEIIAQHRTLVEAVDVSTLSRLVDEQKAQTAKLTAIFPEIQSLLTATVGQNQPDTMVRFYRGQEGIRQMVWHTLRTVREVVGFTYRDLDEVAGTEFMEDWRREFSKRKFTIRDIYSDQYLKSLSQKKYPTQFASESRYVPDKELPVTIQMDIYNDVVAHYNWYEGEVFGVEVYNAKMAKFYRNLFEFVWKTAKSM